MVVGGSAEGRSRPSPGRFVLLGTEQLEPRSFPPLVSGGLLPERSVELPGVYCVREHSPACRYTTEV